MNAAVHRHRPEAFVFFANGPKRSRCGSLCLRDLCVKNRTVLDTYVHYTSLIAICLTNFDMISSRGSLTPRLKATGSAKS